MLSYIPKIRGCFQFEGEPIWFGPLHMICMRFMGHPNFYKGEGEKVKNEIDGPLLS